VAVESWLGTLKLANGTRAKIRNIMSALYSHVMRWEFFDRNPITLLAELTGAYRVMVFVAPTTEAGTDGKGLGRCCDELANGVWVQPAIGLHLRISGYGRHAAALAEQCDEETHLPCSGTSARKRWVTGEIAMLRQQLS
jgi:hypothetical protein